MCIYFQLRMDICLIRFLGVGVITSAKHAEGPRRKHAGFLKDEEYTVDVNCEWIFRISK